MHGFVTLVSDIVSWLSGIVRWVLGMVLWVPGFVHTEKVLHFFQTIKLAMWVVYVFLSNVLVPGPVQMRRDRGDIARRALKAELVHRQSTPFLVKDAFRQLSKQ